MSKLKLHTIPKIDNNHRDPVTESYQNHELKNISIKSNTLDVSVDEDHSENNDKPQKTNDTDEINDDINQNVDDNDIDIKELPRYTVEQLESIDETALKNFKVSEKNIEKPNFNVLDEYDKRVCILRKKLFIIKCLVLFMFIFLLKRINSIMKKQMK